MNLNYKHGRALWVFLFTSLNFHVYGQNIPDLTKLSADGSVNVGLTPDILPAPSNGKYNYYRTLTPLVPINNANSISESSSPTDVQISTVFKDGFNRPIEKVTRNFSSNGNNHYVVPFDTRNFSGVSYQLLPYARVADASAAPDPGAGYSPYTFAYQANYYDGLYPQEGYTGYTAVKNASDANSRKTISYLAGKSQIGQNNGTTTKKVGNDANTIRIWNLDASGLPVANSFYAPDELFGIETVNPEGEYSLTFNDKDGHLIYKKIKLSSLPLQYAETYYIYDQLGALRYTIPPKAVEAIGSGTTVPTVILNNLCFQYNYDAKGRLSDLQHPGQGAKTYMVYDRFERLVMRQTPVENADGKWEVIFYDKLGRAIATSIYNNTNDRSYWQNLMDSPPINPTASTLAYYLTTDGGEGIVPTESAIPGNTMMTYSYYDHYGNTIDNNGNIYSLLEQEQVFQNDWLSIPGAEQPIKSSRTHSLLIGTKTRILKSVNAQQGIGDWKYSLYYYDDKGRIIASAAFDKMANQGQMDYQHAHFVSNQFGFNDQILISKHTVKNNLSLDGNNRHVELVKNEYEPASGRLVKKSHKVNNSGWSTLALYSYDELGRVKRQVLGNYGEVQDFNYNIRGQLNGINAVYAETGNKQNESRTFGQSIKYDYGFTNVRKDGKIAGIVWRGAGSSAKPMSYGYAYDQAGRLKTADFRELTNSAWSNTATDYSVSNLKYDVAGSILSMKQRGMAFENGSLVPKDIDRLYYNYNPNSYRLSNVEDTVTQNYGIGDFVNNNVGSADYKYDLNGNVTGDLNKKIQDITYNHMNKPVAIVFINGDRIEYSYDAEGIKLEEVIKPNGATAKRTDYIGNFVYKNDSLQYLITSKGRTIFNQSNATTKEEFFVTDHLGNVRSVIDVFNWPILQYLASYELASANIEGLYFDNLNEIRDDKPASLNPDDFKAGRLNGQEPDHRVGTSLLLKVMAGDKVELNVNSFYESYSQNDDTPVAAEDMLNAITQTLTSGAGGFIGSESHNADMVGKFFNTENYLNVFNQLVNQSTDPTQPKAYLNYILYDESYKIVSQFSGAFQATGNNAWTAIGTTQPLEIPRNGYLAVYIDNRSFTNVYFDQLSVRFTTGKLKEESHYYPYGLPMGNIGSVASGFVPNKYKYQTNENNNELGLNIMDFNFRQYDAQIGRFMGVDPLGASPDMISPYVAMNNNPVIFTDPSGLTALSDFYNGLLDAFYGGQWDEVIIVGDGPGKSNENPGGGNNPGADYDPGRDGPGSGWGSGSNGGLGSVPNAPGGGGGSASGTGNENAPANTPGSPNGAVDGVTGGGNGHGTNTEDVDGAAANGIKDGSPDGTPDGYDLGWLNGVQNVLDIAGLVPGLEFLDGINGLIYLARGDKLSAGLSFAAMIPIGGQFATAAKSAEKIATKSSMKTGRAMHRVYKAAEHAPELGRIKEFTGIKGIRPDFVDLPAKTIFELKPNNPRSIKRGLKQLEKYKNAFEKRFNEPGLWNTQLDLY
ncbi:hypothetical protein J7E50_10930 [Pedobacter sp. ISL-68]|uniref:RHS repeat-associated core domain-containing protein n=1 Tax=unclassified Pedobacter TaxID=2628915 RepID=UPI001BE7C307|nr:MULTISPECIES: RHS repeat-associated core domain-containing protein [unclassified Pedobacter]MBT2561346.1 hypothetical protein [Pedobacter sp. ISL-64]MBT2590735.1 hypothetical protein [Pedobacter sp. ISL-68]